MHTTSQKEMFSRAFISAIASYCGCNISKLEVDNDSIDMSLMKKDMHGTLLDTAELHLQLKCTQLSFSEDNFLHFDLPIKNYNDLRKKSASPRLLVIVCIPENFEQSIEEQDEKMILRKNAFWYKIKGDDRKNKKSVTVKIRSAIDSIQNF